MDLDSLSVKTKALLLVNEELLNVLSLVSLKLNDLTHLGVVHDSAIAGELLLDDLEDLLLVKLLGETLDGGQGLASIALLNTDMDVILRLFSLSGVFVGFGEGVCDIELAIVDFWSVHQSRGRGIVEDLP